MGQAFGPQLVVRYHREDDEGNAKGDPGEVGRGMGKGFLIGAQQAQERRPEQQHHGHEQEAHAEGRAQAEGGDSAGFFVFLFAQEAGHEGIAAQAPDIPNGNGQDEDRGTDGDACHQVGIAGEGDEPGVHHVVDHIEDHGQHDRNRQLQVGPGHRCVFEKIPLQG